MGRAGNNDHDGTSTDSESQSDVNIVHAVIVDDQRYDKKYECTYVGCNHSFLRPSRLARHIRTHTGERPFKCIHNGCDKAYTNSSHLKRHIETHNITKKTFECTQCLLIISNSHNLKRHCERVHNEKNKPTCKECNAVFNKKYQLAKHSEVHGGALVYRCEKCNKGFTSISWFKRHQQIGHKIYPCTRPKCTEIFDKFVLLRNHLKSNHVTEYKCQRCGKKFLSKAQLKIHSQIHSENRSVTPCPYENCHRSYYYKRNLDHHIRSKHMGKKFYCDICKIGVSAKQKLIEHISRVHDPKKRQKAKKKCQRNKRKDAGIPKKSMVSALIGVKFPAEIEKMILQRESTR